MTRSRHLFAALLLSAVALAVYALRLDDSPLAMHPDETVVTQQAQSVARTLHDVDGRLLPLFFHVRDNLWTTPLPVYFTALLFALGLPESAARFASVLVAVIDVVLLFVVARRVFGRDSLGLLASALLALAPLHFIVGRLALASIYPIAFLLGWLFGLIAFLERRSPNVLIASTACLGFGFYAHPSSVLTMPLCLGLTWLAIHQMSAGWKFHAIAGIGFVLPLLILAPWFYAHYDVFRFTLGDWGLHTLANPRDGLRYSLLNWPALATRSSVYWGFFSPSYLFLTGGADLANSTRQAGVFLGFLAIPLLFGVYDIVTRRWPDLRWRLVLLGFLLAPIAASAFNEPKAAGRAAAMLPFGALIAAAGFEALFVYRVRAVRIAAIAILVLLPLQFYRFWDDYFTNYPVRADVVFGRSVARE